MAVLTCTDAAGSPRIDPVRQDQHRLHCPTGWAGSTDAPGVQSIVMRAGADHA